MTSGADLLIKHVRLLSAAGPRCRGGGGGGEGGRRFYFLCRFYNHEDVTPPAVCFPMRDVSLPWRNTAGTAAKCLCIIHAACKLASCRGAREKHHPTPPPPPSLFSHSRGAAAAAAVELRLSSSIVKHKPLFHIVSPSSITLQLCLFFAFFTVYCPTLNYTICTASIIPPVHSCIAKYTRVVLSPFLPFLYKSMEVPVGLMQF